MKAPWVNIQGFVVSAVNAVTAVPVVTVFAKPSIEHFKAWPTEMSNPIELITQPDNTSTLEVAASAEATSIPHDGNNPVV